jgi:hypothetical protein
MPQTGLMIKGVEHPTAPAFFQTNSGERLRRGREELSNGGFR